MKVLNLYAGIGGNRKLWEDVEVTAVELDPNIAAIYQEYFPDDKVIVDNANAYLLEHYESFDFIWSSPPCQSHSKMMKFTRHDVVKYPDMKLYQEILLLQNFFKGKWAVENVKGYYNPLIPAKEIDRHLFWTNFNVGFFEKPKFNGNYVNAYKPELEKYYGFENLPNIYLDGSHDPAKILKNCVHPEVGLYIMNCAKNTITKQNINQGHLFE